MAARRLAGQDSVILLVRHGQASFGGEVYDRLSATGVGQSRVLGASLARHGISPGSIVAGSMRRQQETAVAMVDAGGWEHEVQVDAAFDEFDVLSFVQAHVEGPATTDPKAFQGILEAGMRRWADGSVLDDAGERFTDFVTRVETGLHRIAQAGKSGPVVIATSAGVISWVVASLLGGDVEQWILLNRVCVNASVTKVVLGQRGLTLLSFNDHGHFSPTELTYR